MRFLDEDDRADYEDQLYSRYREMTDEECYERGEPFASVRDRDRSRRTPRDE